MKHLKLDRKAESGEWGIGGIVWIIAVILVFWPPAGLPEWVHYVCLIIVILPIIIIAGFLVLLGIVAILGSL